MIRNLDLTSLRSFVTIADVGGVTRAAAALSKAAAVARPLFPDRALPPISSVPVSLQPPYANFCVFPYPRVSRFTRAMSQPLSPHILTHGQLPITQRLSG